MKKSLFLPDMTVMFFLMLYLGCMNASAAPWQWQMYLKIDPAEGTPMDQPTSLFVEKDSGRYYVVDSGNNRLLSFEKDGVLLNEFNAKGELDAPLDMVRDGKGQILVVEKGKNSITRIDMKNKELERHTIKDKGALIFPDRIEIDGNACYVLDKSCGDILALNDNLDVKQRFGCTDCEEGFIDFKVQSGTIWALERRKKAVFHFNTDGSLDTEIPLDKAIQFPCSLAVGPAELIYVLDRHQGIVFVLDKTGQSKYNFLTSGHARGQLYYPIEIRFDPWDRLCVVEEGNGRIQVFNR